MFTLVGIIVRLLESVAITGAIYLVTKKSLDLKEMITILLTISVTFLILDLFAPSVATGARQGTGFGLGFTQVAGDGNTMPRQYYDQTAGDGNTMPRRYYEQAAGDGNTMPRRYYDQTAGDGNTMPRRFYDKISSQIVEGMDDPVAINYYSKYNPNQQQVPADVIHQPNMVTGNAQIPSIILKEYTKNPFNTSSTKN